MHDANAEQAETIVERGNPCNRNGQWDRLTAQHVYKFPGLTL